MTSELRSRRKAPLQVETSSASPTAEKPSASPATVSAGNAFRASREHGLDGLLLFQEEPRQFLFLFLVVVAVAHYSFTHDSDDFELNVRNGLWSASFIFLAYCFLQTRDGLLVRPHPGVWRIVHGLSVLYLLLLAALSVQNLASATAAIRVLFPEVGTKATAKPSTSLNCEINSTSPWRCVDAVPGRLEHLVPRARHGVWGKMCMFRDWRFCWVLAVAFELLELIFQFVIPDFQECWWDSLFMDLFGANFIGMCLGRLTLKYLETKEYDWSGKKGYVRRALSQFTPFSWSRYDWEVFSSFKRFALVAVAVFVCLLVELNAFFLLSTLNIPKESHINKYRLGLIFMLGLPAASEYFEFVTNPACWRLGQNAWMMCSIGVFEVLVWVKFADGLAGTSTPPPDVYLPLLAFSALFSLWMLLFFSQRKTDKPSTHRLTLLDVLFYVSFTPLLYLTKQWAY
ncbi:hypothetical protein SPRG_08668 [Saprolegnia parasitica CBS 223.65]|uniref:Phosphatidylserine synthase n=1 Tax=Saprolegnia parasitica (strain CBS 223.65) TaxID=695850 RepID=A0A067CA10_SAPPC|nr:hypothetical protein SPRG_08668 [Saprolegnia parasitica CBS 223.65]KDO26015.1 hypothetical protein SPRG_08668 [Saprolegnia parasitica CBS 223.65]|eukprot:XP_012203301.1 hypothetical protein SPRG_08668 [Saprolegnia parasitica CBS 223.65]